MPCVVDDAIVSDEDGTLLDETGPIDECEVRPKSVTFPQNLVVGLGAFGGEGEPVYTVVQTTQVEELIDLRGELLGSPPVVRAERDDDRGPVVDVVLIEPGDRRLDCPRQTA